MSLKRVLPKMIARIQPIELMECRRYTKVLVILAAGAIGASEAGRCSAQ